MAKKVVATLQTGERTLMEQGDQDGPLREDWRLRV